MTGEGEEGGGGSDRGWGLVCGVEWGGAQLRGLVCGVEWGGGDLDAGGGRGGGGSKFKRMIMG